MKPERIEELVQSCYPLAPTDQMLRSERIRAALTQAVKEAAEEERERCAKVCDEEAALCSRAGMEHQENSDSRDRCFAMAREAEHLAAAIRAGRAP